MTRRNLCAASFFALIASHSGAFATVAIQKESIESGGLRRAYYLFVPGSVAPSAPAPLLVLLHGSGQNGLAVLREWTVLATDEGFILAAPDSFDSLYWHLRKDGPAFIRDVIDSVASGRAIDRKRVYLFGLSGGGVHALTLAMLESEYFAATAVFAGAWREKESYALMPHVKRRIPVSIFVGDRDELFPLRAVRATERALREAGHPVLVTILKRQGHSYPRVAPHVNRAAWYFLSAAQLDADPVFRTYDQG